MMMTNEEGWTQEDDQENDGEGQEPLLNSPASSNSECWTTVDNHPQNRRQSRPPSRTIESTDVANTGRVPPNQRSHHRMEQHEMKMKLRKGGKQWQRRGRRRETAIKLLDERRRRCRRPKRTRRCQTMGGWHCSTRIVGGTTTTTEVRIERQ